MSASSLPNLVVGLVLYNSAADLSACAAALGEQTGAFHLHIFAYDNASSDNSVAALRRLFPDAHLIEGAENLGYGRAHNVLVREAAARGLLIDGNFYMPLNPDVRLQPGYLAALVQSLMPAVRVGWGTGKLLQTDGRGHPTGLLYSAGQGLRRDGVSINIGEGMADAPVFNQPREIMLCSGAAPLFAAALIHDVSDPVGDERDLFDRSMFMYGEDIELGWRARRSGWKCAYVPSAVAYHRGGTPRGNMRAGAAANRVIAIAKNADAPDLFLYHLPRLLLDLLARLLLKPRAGFFTLRHVLRHLPTALRQRRSSGIPRAEMHAWFAWSIRQPTTQLLSRAARLRHFLHKPL